MTNKEIMNPDRLPDVCEIMAGIMERHAGSVSRAALARDLNALVNVEMERCAKIADRYAEAACDNNDAHYIAEEIRSGK